MENRDPNHSDETNLGDVFRTIGTTFGKIGDYFLYTLASFRNVLIDHKIVFILITVVGLSAAAIYHVSIRKEIYKATLVLNCSYLTSQFIENSIDNLNSLAKEKEKENLALELNIEQETAKDIAEFDFEPFVSEEDRIRIEVLKEQLSTVTVENKTALENILAQLQFNNRNSFKITVKVYDASIIKKIEPAIVNHFRDNDFIKRRIEINRTNLNSRKEKLIEESQKLDSLKRVLFRNFQAMANMPRGSNNVTIGEEKMTNPLDVFSQDLALNNEILEIERALYVNPDFEVVEGFMTSKQPANLGLVETLAIAFILSILFGYVFVGIWKFNKLLDKYPTRTE